MSEEMKTYAYREKTKTRPDYAAGEKNLAALKRLLGACFSLPALFNAACGFFLWGAVFFEVLNPFGTAWLIAAAAEDRRPLPLWFAVSAAGAFLFCGERFLLYGAIIALLLIAAAVTPKALRQQALFAPVSVFAAVTLVRGAALIFTGISDIALVIILTESILAAGFSSILRKAQALGRTFRRMERPGRGDILCVILFVGAVLLGMERLTFYGVSPANAVICLLILAAAYFGGEGGGAAAGAIAGVIPTFALTTAPALIGLLAFSGFTAGLFKKLGRFALVFGYLFGNILLSLYLLHTSVTAPMIVESLIGATVFLLIPKKSLSGLADLFWEKGSPPAKVAAAEKGDDYALTRIEDAAAELAAIRETVAELHRQAAPVSEKKTASILDHIQNQVCFSCSMRQVCWGSDRLETVAELTKAFAVADADDRVLSRRLPEGLRRRCCHTAELSVALNCLCERYRAGAYWQRQAVSGRELALLQVDHGLRILEELAEDIASRREKRRALAASLGKELRRRGVRVDRVLLERVGGDEIALRLKTRHCAGSRRCEREIAAAVSHLTGQDYVTTVCRCGDEPKEKICAYRCAVKSGLDLDVNSVQLTKEGSAVCGDSESDWDLCGSRRALFISDGMGSGYKAHQEAEWTLKTVKTALSRGEGRDLAAGLVRYRMLMDKADELYATFDLCLIDRDRREAEFVKLGAADSYLCSKERGMKVIPGVGEKREGAPPLRGGREKLSRGDVIIMASDGVSAADQDTAAEEWLFPLVAAGGGESAAGLGDRILREAVKRGGGKVKDDITVTVAKVV